MAHTHLTVTRSRQGPNGCGWYIPHMYTRMQRMHASWCSRHQLFGGQPRLAEAAGALVARKARLVPLARATCMVPRLHAWLVCRNVKLRLKEGEEWRETSVTVPTSSGHRVMVFDQPVGPGSGGRLQRLCCNCKRAIRDASAADSGGTLSMLDLFCQTKCALTRVSLPCRGLRASCHNQGE